MINNYINNFCIYYRKDTVQKDVFNHNNIISDCLQLRRSTLDSESTSSSFSSSENIPRFLSPVQRLNIINFHTSNVAFQNSLSLLKDFDNLPKAGDCLEVRVTIAPNPTSFMVCKKLVLVLFYLEETL